MESKKGGGWSHTRLPRCNSPSVGMRETLQQYLLEVMDDRRGGARAYLIKCALWVLSLPYRAAVWLRLRLYAIGAFRRHSLGCLTISVGNITLGGTGKTPVVESLARALSERGHKVAVLSRGYKSKGGRLRNAANSAALRSPRVVSDGEKVALGPLRAGDEAFLLAENLRGTAVLVDKDRLKAGRYALSHMGVDTLILDDAFQYLALGERLDLVLIDSTNPFGNGHLLPRGILREPLSSLKRADCFVLTKTAGVELGALKNRLRELNPRAEIVETVHQPLYFEEVCSGRREPPPFALGREVYLVSAIARPEGFEKEIERLGGRIRKSIRFLDHHRFSPDEIEQVLEDATTDAVQCIFTTQKDAVRLPPIGPTPIPIFFLRVAVRITRGAANFADCVTRISHARKGPLRRVRCVPIGRASEG